MQVEVQYAYSVDDVPGPEAFHTWAEAATGPGSQAELVVRIVDELESAELNQTYRGKPAPTNVLSFPFEAPPHIKTDLLGDVVICAPVVVQEAREQGKSAFSHWAHMVVHGILHLRGYDHETETDAAVMEALEVEIMCQLGYGNPYV